MSLNWRRHVNYLFVIPLCALALTYQISSTVAVMRDTVKGYKMPDAPFVSVDGTVILSSDAAKADGLRPGDRVLSIDGRAFDGDRMLYQTVDRMHPGDMIDIAVVPKGQQQMHMMHVPVDHRSSRPPTSLQIATRAVLALSLLLCVLTGVYIAIRLPNDRRALAAAGLLVSLSQAVQLASWNDFPQSLWVVANVWPPFWQTNWSIVIVAFGLYFPQQFAWDLRRPWLKWLYLGPLFVFNCFVTAVGVLPQFSFREFNLLAAGHPGWLAAPAFFIAVSITAFFVCIGIKQGIAKVPDLKRRLRILEAGAAVGLGPIGVFLLYRAISGTNTGISEDVLLVLCSLFLVFPVTLAYAVLTERALDLRVVIRQGVRYTMARQGLRVSLSLFGVVFFSFLSAYLWSAGISDTTRALVLGGSILLFIFLVRRIRQQAFDAIDKKFFREQYHAEIVLSELSENVRTIVNEHELLDTVSRRVSEALHVSHFSVLLSGGSGRLRPVYSLGLAIPEAVELDERGECVSHVANSKEATPIYFDRPDNWVYAAPEDELVVLKTLGAQLLLPLKTKEKLLGLFCLGPKKSEEPFSKTDINLLRSIALQTGLALDNSRLTAEVAREVAQRERLNREIEIAREVQERLFPQHLPLVAGVDYSGCCRPALGVGGDYYDFLNLPNGELGIAIGDVSGKGIAAALLMASLQASLRGQTLAGLADLSKLMSNVNRLVYDATPINRYATFFYGQYDRETRLFRYVNAGHNAPFVVRCTSDRNIHLIRLDTGGPVVGLFPEAPYQQGSLVLQPGDIFVGFTDGISEAMNKAEEEWGEEHLIKSVVAHAKTAAADMIPQLMADADRFVDGAPQHDDMTLVVVKLAA